MFTPFQRLAGITLALVVCMGAGLRAADDQSSIRPSSDDPRYWQFDGRPVMLLGGSQTDHLFLIDGLEEHLDDIQAVGGNYVRNTMSQREEQERKPHRLMSSGKFDLDQWNDDYWNRFENFLRWTAEREIFVQIEVWDRFDFSQQHWRASPWNPANNVNYSSDEVGLATEYPAHPARDRQPFFHSIAGMPRYDTRLDLIRRYQEAFVRKLLSYSLDYGHVLYCMNNETSTPAEWGQHWIELIRDAAKAKGRVVHTTDMFDDAFRGDDAVHTPMIFQNPRHYTFADISQVNSRNYDDTHWERLQWLLERVNTHPRPSNHTKIYGSGYMGFGTGGPEDGVERFWRNILAGSAAARFHRKDAGNGFNDRAQASIRAARLLEQRMKFWDIEPQLELLSDREPNEAYVAADPGRSYALYFTNGGSVTLDLTGAQGRFNVAWISVSMGLTMQTTSEPGKRRAMASISGGKRVKITAPYKGGWVAAITRANDVASDTGSRRSYDRFSGLEEYNQVAEPPAPQLLALTHATLIDGRGSDPVEDATVLIRGNRIAKCGTLNADDLPPDATIIDCAGMSVLPGLVDTHFHTGSNEKMHEIPALFLSHGVTTARDPGRPIDVYAPIRTKDNDTPRLFLTGPHFDQSPPAWPDNAVIIDSADAAQTAVLQYMGEGASGIKVYFRLPIDCIQATCRTAHQHRIPVTAHLELVDADDGIAAGLDGIEHITSFGTALAEAKAAERFRRAVASENDARRPGRYQLWADLAFDNNPRADRLIRQIVRRAVFVSPTLATFERQADGRSNDVEVAAFRNMQRFVGLCHQGGAVITTGSHTWSRHVDLGWAYQREMELLVESGLTPLEVITASTLNGARFLGCADRLGTLEADKLADLILVDGRPDEDIRAMYNVRRVMLNGVWIAESPESSRSE